MFSQEIIVKSRQADLLHEAEANRLARTATKSNAKGSRIGDVLSALGQGLSALGTVQPNTPTRRKRTATSE